MKRNWIIGLCAGILAVSSAQATSVTALGDFASWHAYSFDENGAKVCFMSAAPAKKEISNAAATRGEPELFITHRTEDGSRSVVSVNLGYTPVGEVTVSIDGKNYTLTPEGETGWTNSDAADETLTAALQKGSTAVIRAQSARGTKTTDTYDLKASSKAYLAISNECGR